MLELESELVEVVKQAKVMFLDQTKRDEVIESMVQSLEGDERLASQQTFLNAIMHREKVVSTGIGMGIAIPHAKLIEAKAFFLVIGIHQGSGVDWDAIDSLPVKLVFMIGGPDTKHKEYLNLLSEITGVLKDEDKREQLIRAKDAQDVVNIFDSC